jgi:hypothetical protein
MHYFTYLPFSGEKNIKICLNLGLGVFAYNPSIQESEAEGILV